MNYDSSNIRSSITRLDYARAFFTVAVVFAHANLIVDSNLFCGFFVQGWSGVDFFFILSGFLFYYNYKKTDTAFLYCKKRFVRIFPSYWVYTIITVIIYVIKNYMSSRTLKFGDYTIKIVLQSVLCIPTDMTNHVNPIIPTAWTLPYEIIFYIFGLILIVSRNYKVFHISCTIWGLFIIFFSLLFPSFLPFIFSVFFLEFMFGIIIAIIVGKNRNFKYGKIYLGIGIIVSIIRGQSLFLCDSTSSHPVKANL